MHRNARLTPAGRLLLCQRIEAGWPVAHAAAAMGISRDRAYVWWRRYQEEGLAGLEDRSSRPHHCPNRTRPAVERRIATLRQKRGLGPARIAGIVARPASTVHRVLVRQGLNRLDHLDRATRTPIRRIEMSRPGELVHLDVKKLGRIPRGGGWRVHGRGARPSTHRTRKAAMAYSEVHANEQATTAVGFWYRAQEFFTAHGLVVERVLTDNGACYRSKDFARALGDVIHTFTQPYRPATNGKIERFNRTLLVEWAYARPWSSDGQRTRALDHWLHLYNHHRHHTAIGGPPVSRVSNLAGSYS
jgi:transposase InsO family protein